MLRDGIEPDDEGSKVNAYDFKLGAAEKVGEREAKVVHYRFGNRDVQRVHPRPEDRREGLRAAEVGRCSGGTPL